MSGLPAVEEEPRGAGPLVALLAGVGALGNPRVVVLLACDLPFVDAALLQLLVEWPGPGTVIPVVDGRFQYACARYGAAALDEAVGGVAHGRVVAARHRGRRLRVPDGRRLGRGHDGARVRRRGHARRLGTAGPRLSPYPGSVQSDLVVRRPVTGAVVLAVDGEQARERRDELATEEPMEIRVHGPGQEPAPVAVAMRTPGQRLRARGRALPDRRDHHVADRRRHDRRTASRRMPTEPDGKPEQQYNIVTVRLRRPVAADVRERRYLATSACGVCGKAALDEVEVRCEPVGAGPRVPRRASCGSCPSCSRSGSVCSTGPAGCTPRRGSPPTGELVAVREDVGRHNALDKLIGHALLDDALPLADNVLLVSGRLSFELVQKAAIAGIPVLCAVSAPSSLAVAAAERFGQTVVGFLRGERFNVYTHRERIDLAA